MGCNSVITIEIDLGPHLFYNAAHAQTLRANIGGDVTMEGFR
jgi:hypothetical protein